MKNTLNKNSFKIYWQHLKKYRLRLFVLIISIILGSVTNILAPLYYKEFFDILSAEGEAGDKVPGLLDALLMVLVIYLIGWVFWRIATYVNSLIQTRTMADLSRTCFNYVHGHSVNFFNNNFVGSVVKKINRFSRAFEGIFDLFTWDLLPVTSDVLLIIIILYGKNWMLATGILVWILIYCLLNYFFSLYKIKHDLLRSEKDSEVTGVLADTITNNQNVKLLTGYHNEVLNYEKVTDELRRLRQFSWNLNTIFDSVQVILMIFLELGIFYLAVRYWAEGFLTIGDFVLLQAYLMTIFHRLWNFGRVIRNYFDNMADANEMTEILSLPHEIQDVKNPGRLEVSEGRIVFADVNFSYNQTRRIFFRLNLEIKPREKVALVGPSGSGKSTLANLLLRNHDVTGGKIKIDDQKISSVSQESLRQNISLVPQDPILFHRTLMENIRYGQPTASDEQVIEASRQAFCHEFILQLDKGYETMVGERGVKLSGGERQRVAIARAILKNASILILDEATSSLDSESEEKIQTALHELMKNKTVMVIAHRLSTIMKMDRIIVLREGKIVEQGTHQELLIAGDLYKRLWERQVGGFLK